MATIFDYVTAKEIAAYWVEGASNRIPYLGATLFPGKKQLGLELSWLKGSKGLPVSLKPSAFDTKPTLRDRIGFDRLVTEMPFFREAMMITEKDRQNLNNVIASGNEKAIEMIVRNIYDDAAGLIDSAEVVFERMRMQLLSTGKIAITENGNALDYDYQFDSDHLETLENTAMWSDLDDSTPIQDIQDWCDAIEDDTGIRPNRAICSRATLLYLIQNAGILKELEELKLMKTEENIRMVIEKHTKVQIAVYNKKYSASGSAVQFFPDNVFTLFPAGVLGSSVFGTTPEESDLMTSANADVQIVNTGVALTSLKKVEIPVNVETVVSMIGLPSFEGIDTVFIATVHTD